MGIQTMNSHMAGRGQQSHMQHSLQRCNSWLGLTLDEVERHLLGNLAKPLGSMNLDELLKKVWTTDSSRSSGIESIETSSAASLQRQASWSLARAFSGKTVNEVWRDIQRGYKKSNVEGWNSQVRAPTLGETTLEDFLVKAGMYVSSASNVSIEPVMSLDSALKSHKFSSQMGLSPSPSIDELSDTPLPGRKRISGDLEKAVERRLRRKIKNRESAARSRARKQAYHNELVTKVSRLEEENSKLKKEKFRFLVERVVCLFFLQYRSMCVSQLWSLKFERSASRYFLHDHRNLKKEPPVNPRHQGTSFEERLRSDIIMWGKFL